MFSARDQNVLSFSHLACYCLAIFSKVHEFVQNNVFSQISARFVIFAVANTTFYRFSAKCTSLCKTAFTARSACLVIFALGASLFLQFSLKCTSLYKTAFSAKDQQVLSFSHSAHHLLAIFSKVHQFCTKQRFQP